MKAFSGRLGRVAPLRLGHTHRESEAVLRTNQVPRWAVGRKGVTGHLLPPFLVLRTSSDMIFADSELSGVRQSSFAHLLQRRNCEASALLESVHVEFGARHE